LLSDPASNGGGEEDAFHLVCPSLPGFGFSDRPTKPGWNVKKIASAGNELMIQLGYNQYFAQGGDWGSIITTEIGIQNLGNCRGLHINMPLVSPDPKTLAQPTELEKEALIAMKYYQDHDSGYSKQQGTRPQTLGYGLSDSPIGQAAWILEKFYQWMDCQGRPENAVSRDELLDNVMIYWWTNSAASSARIYWESMNATDLDSTISIPSGISVFPKEIFKTSERWAKNRFTDLRHFNVLNKGGHFAAFEQPELFVKEIRTCFAKMDM
jgi:pimeloyl-ACP methyl ester carboxylesterase